MYSNKHRIVVSWINNYGASFCLVYYWSEIDKSWREYNSRFLSKTVSRFRNLSTLCTHINTNRYWYHWFAAYRFYDTDWLGYHYYLSMMSNWQICDRGNNFYKKYIYLYFYIKIHSSWFYLTQFHLLSQELFELSLTKHWLYVANIRSFFVNIARYLLPEGFKWLILPEGFSPKVILVSWSLKVTNSGDIDV